MLTEISQAQKDKYCAISYRAPTVVTLRGRKWNRESQRLGRGDGCSQCLMGTEFQLGEDDKVVEVDSCTTM